MSEIVLTNLDSSALRLDSKHEDFAPVHQAEGGETHVERGPDPAAGESGLLYCEHCHKTYRSYPTFLQHVTSRRHRQRQEAAEASRRQVVSHQHSRKRPAAASQPTTTVCVDTTKLSQIFKYLAHSQENFLKISTEPEEFRKDVSVLIDQDRDSKTPSCIDEYSLRMALCTILTDLVFKYSVTSKLTKLLEMLTREIIDRAVIITSQPDDEMKTLSEQSDPSKNDTANITGSFDRPLEQPTAGFIQEEKFIVHSRPTDEHSEFSTLKTFPPPDIAIAETNVQQEQKQQEQEEEQEQQQQQQQQKQQQQQMEETQMEMEKENQQQQSKDAELICAFKLVSVSDDSLSSTPASSCTVVSVEQCLFCARLAGDIDDNLDHMELVHQFVPPMREHLVDVDGLVRYLGAKVHLAHMCLWCSVSFGSVDRVKYHMETKGHTSICFTPGIVGSEYSDYYDPLLQFCQIDELEF